MNTRELLALRRSNPGELAELLAPKAVQRGIRWLDRHARKGWYRNLFEPRDGQFIFRASIGDDIGTVLTLAFEERSDLVDQFGYVSAGNVARQYGLSREDLILLGFDARYLFEKGFRIDRATLRQAWQEAISSFHRDSLAIRYRTQKEQQMLDQLTGFDFRDYLRGPSLSEKIGSWVKVCMRAAIHR